MRQITAIIMLTLFCSCVPLHHLDMSRKYYSKPQPISIEEADKYGKRGEINLVNAVKTEHLNEIQDKKTLLAYNVDYKQHTDNIIAFLTEELEKRNIVVNNNSNKKIMLELESISADSKWTPFLGVNTTICTIDLRVSIPEINFSKAYLKQREEKGILDKPPVNIVSSLAIRDAVIDFLKEPELIRFLTSSD